MIECQTKEGKKERKKRGREGGREGGKEGRTESPELLGETSLDLLAARP